MFVALACFTVLSWILIGVLYLVSFSIYGVLHVVENLETSAYFVHILPRSVHNSSLYILLHGGVVNTIRRSAIGFAPFWSCHWKLYRLW
jgi:hypothetical protein